MRSVKDTDVTVFFYDRLTHSVEKELDRKTFVRFYFIRSKRSKHSIEIELYQFNF